LKSRPPIAYSRSPAGGTIHIGFWWSFDGHRGGYRRRTLSVEPLVDLPLAPFRVEVWHLPRFARLAWAQHHHGREGNDSNSEQNEADQHQHGADLRCREQGRIGGGSRRRFAKSDNRRVRDAMT
jgi:hypothetical protein